LTIDVRSDVLVVQGDTPLRGEVTVRGAKNLVSKAMVAALLGDSPSRLYDVPRIRDVEIVRGLLEPTAYACPDGVEPGEVVLI
jgi:UDP-N-acetylglucosamine 1-carboxyvinyltransferase